MSIVTKTLFKGADALLMENDVFKVIVLIQGSKMVSLKDKQSGRELLLQSNNEKYIKGKYDSDYVATEPNGFDEMFPTIDVCYCEQPPWEGVKLPDHGEVWALDWEYTACDTCLEMHTYGVRLPYRLSKKFHFTNAGVLRIEYCLNNLTRFDMDFLWAAHAMFTLDDNSMLLLPDKCRNASLTFSNGNRFSGSHYGDKFNIADKFDIDADNKLSNPKTADRYMDKFYIDDDIACGKCGISYPSDHCAYMMEFPVSQVPFLGILLTNGYDFGNCAIIEPCTAAFDRIDRAKAFGKSSTVKANGSYEWHLEFKKISQ